MKLANYTGKTMFQTTLQVCSKVHGRDSKLSAV